MLVMGHLAPGIMFENMLKLIRFDVAYLFERILSKPLLFAYRNSDNIVATHARVIWDICPPKKLF